METRQIRAFLAVSEELNFRKAADKLGMTQPPLTRLISQLEYELDTQLFLRNTRSVELTGAGLHLLKRGRELILKMDEVEKEVRALKQSKSGIVIISMDFGAFHTSLPKLISSFKEQFPNISLRLEEAKQSSLKTQLDSGKVDVYFGANVFKEPRFNQVSVQSRELSLIHI